MRYLLALCFLFCIDSYTQVLSGVVKDSISGELLSYVNITLLNSDKGTSTNSRGEFKIEISGDSMNDTLLVSYIGYEPQLFPVVKINKVFKTICLRQKRDEIEEIQLKIKKARYASEKKIGLKRKGDYWYSEAYGSEVCVWIKNEERKPGKLTAIHLFFKKNKGKHKEWKNYQAYFLVKFYKFDIKKRKPGGLLNFKPILIKPKNKRSTVKLDVEDLNILYPEEGICVGVETVKPAHLNPKESVFSTYPYQVHVHTREALTWSSYRGKPWKKRRRKSYFKRNYYTNLLVQLKVKYRK